MGIDVKVLNYAICRKQQQLIGKNLWTFLVLTFPFEIQSIFDVKPRARHEIKHCYLQSLAQIKWNSPALLPHSSHIKNFLYVFMEGTCPSAPWLRLCSSISLALWFTKFGINVAMHEGSMAKSQWLIGVPKYQNYHDVNINWQPDKTCKS